MRVTRINANLPVADIDAARDFYTDYRELNVEEFPFIRGSTSSQQDSSCEAPFRGRDAQCRG
jgi:catechol 2,3-dioxygenase-like lactoylglutathione lyase family enzyme